MSTIDTVPQTSQKYVSVSGDRENSSKSMLKYEVKKERGRKMTVIAVKTKMALFCVSAIMASSFCSMDRS
jgi:hypothetical protein